MVQVFVEVTGWTKHSALVAISIQEVVTHLMLFRVFHLSVARCFCLSISVCPALCCTAVAMELCEFPFERPFSVSATRIAG